MDRKELINRSMDYIMGHLEENLSLDTISAHFYLSKYHFSRLFKKETGETVYAFLKRCRVDQSAVDLKLDPTKKIMEIGLDYGYSSSNYSSLFKKRHQVSPAAFRRSVPTQQMPLPFAPQRNARFKTAEEYSARIDVQELNDFFVVYERFIGSYLDLEKHWAQFLERNKDLQQKNTILIERFFQDPAITASPQCVCDICMTVERGCKLEHVTWIKGGTWAIYHFEGEIKDIFEALQGVFNVWLPQSGHSMSQRYGLNIYRHIDWERHSVVMDLCIPI